MAPPGRRRATGPSSISFITLVTIAILVILSDVAAGASAVLGLDVGTEYIKAALVKPGIPLEIVLTKDSKRKEAAAIAFKPSDHIAGNNTYFPERLYGADSLALAPRFPSDVYPNLKHVLGAAGPFRDAAVSGYAARFPALDIPQGSSDEAVRFRTKSLGNDGTDFSVEELLAMQLKSIKTNAENMAGSGHTIRDVVVTVPAFYTADERRAIELSVELAGLKVISLVSDGLAVGLNYATSRTFRNVDEGQKPEFHLVYDMGAGSTTATILRCRGKTTKDVGKFNKTVQEVAVVGLGWDRTLGGDALNDLIVNDMAEQFAETSGAKAAKLELSAIKQNGRTMAKLWREAERLRQVLSANSATSAGFEGLQDDVDFRYKLSRTGFETLASTFNSRIGKPVMDALGKANLSMTELDSIILHGGAVRTPFVQATLDTLTKDSNRLKGNVNADEAAVFGAAFKAAGLSPSFRVKEIKSEDAAGYELALAWSSNGKERRQSIFGPTSQVGATKHVPFRFQDDFSFYVQQAIPVGDSDEVVDRQVLNVQTQNLTASVSELIKSHGCSSNAINVTLSIRLGSAAGLPEILRGVATCEAEAMEKKGGVVDDVKGFFGFGAKKDQKPLQGKQVSGSASSAAPERTPPFTDSEISTAAHSSQTSVPQAVQKKLVSISLDLKVERVGLLQPPRTELERINQRLAAFDRSDKGRRLRDELFNILEGLTYKTRDMLSDDEFVMVSTNGQREELESTLKTTGEWLYAEGTLAGYEVVKEKLQELRGLVDPINNRKSEASKRPKSIENLQNTLNQTSLLLRLVRDQVEKAAASASASAASTPATPLESSTTASDSAPDQASTDDLDDESTTTKSTSARATPSKADTSLYSEDDLKQLTSIFESVRDWLAEKIEGQNQLSPSEDPILLSEEVESRRQQLSKFANDLARRKLKIPSKSKSNTTKTQKKTNSANASSTSATDGSSPSSSFEKKSTETDDGSISSEETGKPRDEL